ncbi:hypothetical protein [Sphingobacterium sp. B29]|uniref:hypothetical protein n=1 Tax=Sphingobacterium sp. B29 TaxID=1933220 RepID=UPI0012F7C142|nr:hypothetical protein [Sphingobacterium sp. B29]
MGNQKCCLLSPFYVLGCSILAVPFFPVAQFSVFPVRILPGMPRRLLGEDPDRIMQPIISYHYYIYQSY